jgi:hypothetical protein
MNGQLKIALIALDFLIGYVENRPDGRDAAHSILELRIDVERLATEAQQHAVDDATVTALIVNLAMAIGVVLQLSPRIELLAPGLTIQMTAPAQTNKK